MSGSGRKVHPDDSEWSRGPPGCPGVVRRPSRMSGIGGDASRMTVIGREALPDV